MSESSLERRVSRHLLKNCLRVRRGENLLVETWNHSLEMVSTLVDEARKLGVHTMVVLEDERAFWSAMDRKQGKLLGESSDPEWAALSKADAYVFFWGPEDRPRGERYGGALWEQALAYNPRWYAEARAAGLRGVRIEAARATDPVARSLGVNGKLWRKQLLEGSLADPRSMAAAGARLARQLKGARKLHLTHRNGTDLELKLGGTTPQIFTGLPEGPKAGPRFRLMTTAPAGSFYTTLDGQVAEGRIVANRTSYVDNESPEAVDTWTFKDGRLVSWTFRSGKENFERRYAKGSKGKDRPGLLAIGLNDKLGEVPNMEDSEAGAIMVGVGGNRPWGGSNPSSFVGWAALQGAELTVDGKAVVRGGRVL